MTPKVAMGKNGGRGSRDALVRQGYTGDVGGRVLISRMANAIASYRSTRSTYLCWPAGVAACART